MIRNHIFITLSLFLICTVAIAEPQQDPGKSVEEIERQKIISELSYRLDTRLTCEQKLTWSDKGSGADLNGFFYTPSTESSYYIIGGYASRKGGANTKKCVVSVRPSKNNPEKSLQLLVSPNDWLLIWTDKGSGANKNGSMWKAVPPGKEYKCLGSVMQKGYKKPVLSDYRCVHSDLTKEIENKSIVWTDKGSGADKDVTVFYLPNSKSFFAIGRKISDIKLHDLNDSASAEPDAAVVEKILAQRMEAINKIDEEKMRLADEKAKKQIAEQERFSESKKIAEQKRIAEESEKQQKAEEAAVQENLVAEAEKQKQEKEAEKKRKTEVSEQQERLVVEAEQERSEQGEEGIQEADVPEQQSATEMILVQQQVIEKTGEKDSKAGLKILFAFMLLLLIYAAYKVLGIFISIIKGDK